MQRIVTMKYPVPISASITIPIHLRLRKHEISANGKIVKPQDLSFLGIHLYLSIYLFIIAIEK